MNENRMSIHELRRIRSTYFLMLPMEIMVVVVSLLITTQEQNTDGVFKLILLVCIPSFVMVVITAILILIYGTKIAKSNKDSKKF